MKRGITNDEMWAVGMYLRGKEGLRVSMDESDGTNRVLTKIFVCKGYGNGV